MNSMRFSRSLIRITQFINHIFSIGDSSFFDDQLIIEVIYLGDKDELKDKYALGKYRLLTYTNIQKSVVYVKEDEADSVTEAPGCKSFIFRNWDDGKWIGTVK